MTNAIDFAPGGTVLVIPAYNEALAIGDVLARCVPIARRIIVVDDGSSDGTWPVIAGHPVMALRHSTNRGKAAALRTGINQALEAGADRVITLDADGQHRPEDLVRLIAAAAGAPGAIVTGSRRADGDCAPRSRYWANRVADFWISWAAGQSIEDTQSGFRLYPATVLWQLLGRVGRSHGFAFESEILIEAGRAGIPIVAVPIPALYGGTTLRASHFRPLHDIPKIIVMVGWKLLKRGMFPAGLWRVLFARAGRRAAPDAPPLGHAAID